MIRERIVTPGQLSEGYYEVRGMIGWNRKFREILRFDDGNYLVAEPEPVVVVEDWENR